MVKQNRKIGVSTVVAGIFTLITLYEAFVSLSTSILSSVILVIAALLIAPILNEVLQQKMQAKFNFSFSTPLRWIAWFVLSFFVAAILK